MHSGNTRMTGMALIVLVANATFAQATDPADEDVEEPPDEITQEIGGEIEAPSGDITNAEKHTFPGYVAAILEAKRAAQSICTSTHDSASTFYLIDDAGLASMAQTHSISVDIKRRAELITTRLEAIKNALAPAVHVHALATAELAALAPSFDIAGGLIKSVAGLAQLFRKEISYHELEVNIDSADVAVLLRNCPTTPLTIVDSQEMVVVPTNSLLKLLVDTQISIGEVSIIVDQRIAQLPKDENGTTTDTEDAKLLLRFQQTLVAMSTEWDELLDEMTTVDAEKAVSDLVLAERNEYLLDQVTANNTSRFLNLQVRRAEAITRTTKRIFGSQKQHFAGGISVRYQVQDASGNVIKSGIEFGQSDWIELRHKKSKSVSGFIDLQSK